MDVVQVITGLSPAGAERIVASLSIGLKKRGYSVAVISLQPLPAKSIIVDELLENNISIKSLNLTKFTPWRIFKLKRLIRSLNPISLANPKLIIHSHLIHANLVCRINNIFGKKYNLINTIHIAEKRKRKKWYFWLDRLTLKFCNCQTAVSKAAAQYHASKLNIPTEQIKVVYNGIMQPGILDAKAIEKLKTEWGVNDCNKIVGSVGRLDWQKGYDIFLALLPELSKRIPSGEKWGVVILGEGPERKNLEKWTKKIPTNIKLILPGYRNDAASCINAFDLFVMPSRYEGFGLTLAEAMALGIPILCSNADSLPELITNYSNGKVIDFSNPNSIEDILATANKKRDEFKNVYSIKNMVDSYVKIYKS